jgi:hypothetical protein
MSYTNATFRIVHQSDRAVLAGLRQAIDAAGLEFTRGTLELAVGPQLKLDPTTIESDPIVRELLEQKSIVTAEIVLSVEIDEVEVAVQVTRVPHEATDSLTIHATSLSYTGANSVRTLALSRLVAASRSALKSVDVQGGYAQTLGKEVKRHLETREAELLRLEDISTGLIETLGRQAAEVRARLEAEYVEREQDMRERMEAERVALQDEIERSKTELQSRRAELDERAAEMDVLDTRAARRRDRQELAKRITASLERFTLTQETRQKRLPIHITCITLLLLLAAFTGYNAWVLSDMLMSTIASQLLWVQSGRSLIGGIALASTAVFYIRWSNHWFDRHADAEFRLKRMALDLDRANWVVEMALEWRDEKGTDAPAILVDRLTADLFTDDGTRGAVLHPSEQLANAIFGAATELRVPVPGGGEVRYDRKGMQRLTEPRSDTP